MSRSWEKIDQEEATFILREDEMSVVGLCPTIINHPCITSVCTSPCAKVKLNPAIKLCIDFEPKKSVNEEKILLLFSCKGEIR